MSTTPDRRLLLVHAHPDDESINNGATMAAYAAAGAHITLVTCTLGEEGEVIPPDLAHLAPDAGTAPLPASAPAGASSGRHGGSTAAEGGTADGEAHAADSPTPLGRHRTGELAAAMRELGVTDHRFLGGPGRYRDSGMMGAPTNERPRCFWQAPLDDAAAFLVQVIREVRPQVLVTYDPDGGYGHPDHVKAHRVAMRAVELAADENFTSGQPGARIFQPHAVGCVYWNCVPRSALEPGFARLRALAGTPEAPFPGVAEPTDVPGLVDDAEPLDVVVDGSGHAGGKAAAMAAHVTQVTVAGDFFALSNGLGQPLLVTEYYRCADGWRRPGAAPADDLFAEVDV